MAGIKGIGLMGWGLWKRYISYLCLVLCCGGCHLDGETNPWGGARYFIDGYFRIYWVCAFLECDHEHIVSLLLVSSTVMMGNSNYCFGVCTVP